MNSPERTTNLKTSKKISISRILTSWEMILIYMLIFINVALMILKPDLFFAQGTIQSIIKSGMDYLSVSASMLIHCKKL